MREALNQIIEFWRTDQINPLVSNIFPLSDTKTALKIVRDRQARGVLVEREHPSLAGEASGWLSESK
ncbi:MAG TPA: hypothetical protein EYQ00_06115 [Dehalococcoidia bacterium]|nr:hypothetical protein [Dehalococcoidia bacterium]